MTLLLHTGAEPIEYDALRDLPIPAATSTHVPIPHHRVVDMLVHTLAFYGHEVFEQHHVVTKDGLRYFGLLSLRSPTPATRTPSACGIATTKPFLSASPSAPRYSSATT